MSPMPRSGFDPASPDATSLDYAILQQAAEWFALLRSEQAGKRDRQRWQQWVDAAPAHRQAWGRVEAVNRQFGVVPGPQAHEMLRDAGRQRRATVKKLVLLCLGTGVGAGLLLRRDPHESLSYLAGWRAHQRTGVGETRALALADGGRLWLNTGSALDIDYGTALRRIALYDGEIVLRSGIDRQRPARPLVVDAPHGRLRALGTRFSVRVLAGATQLAVFDGAVQVEPREGGPVRTVPAGMQLRFGADWVGTPSPADENAAAWSRGQLMPDQMRLDEFIAELGRYRRGYLGCAPAVAHLRLVGSYPLADTDRILSVLEATLPVRVRRLHPWWVSVEPS